MLKQLANMTTEKLIEMFELTTNMNDENIPTVRGWLMDEIEKRNPDGFDKFDRVLEAKNLTERYQYKAGWNEYTVTERAFDMLQQKYSISQESLLD